VLDYFALIVLIVLIAVVNIRSSQLVTRVNFHLALGGSFEEDAEKRVVEGAAGE
jgi:hypothetical protein